MLKDHLSSLVKKHIGYKLTKGQQSLLDSLCAFSFEEEKSVLLVKGYAGTGKTSLLSAFVKAMQELQQNVVLMAPTGRAAKVFSAFAGAQAFTIHKVIYKQKSSKDGFGTFVLDRNLHKNTLFIVDEASMIGNSANENVLFGSGNLLEDLIRYVYNDRNCRLILSGDQAQLPPVGLDLSPALNVDTLRVLNLVPTEVQLTDVVRHELESGILFNATAIRTQLANVSSNRPQLNVGDFEDICRITGADLLEAIDNSYSKNGLEQTIVVTRSNKLANRYNMGIRNQILYREEELARGELLMVVRNNYFWFEEAKEDGFIANGDIVELVRISSYEERYGFRYANATIRLVDFDNLELDVKLLLDTLSSESAALTAEENKKLFYTVLEDYADLKPKKKQYEQVKLNPYFNALQIKYAYAVTCHKAQGGQWKTVFIDQGFVDDTRINTEYLRWLYTAITRSSNKLYLVNFKDDFFV
jgi:exodeoxyribonuclease V